FHPRLDPMAVVEMICRQLIEEIWPHSRYFGPFVGREPGDREADCPVEAGRGGSDSKLASNSSRSRASGIMRETVPELQLRWKPGCTQTAGNVSLGSQHSVSTRYLRDFPEVARLGQ
ncbi:MAG: hypothetical protein ACRD6W_00290, partial [Nitrososphaerales archaeon]